MHEGNHMGIMTTLKKPTAESPGRAGARGPPGPDDRPGPAHHPGPAGVFPPLRQAVSESDAGRAALGAGARLRPHAGLSALSGARPGRAAPARAGAVTANRTVARRTPRTRCPAPPQGLTAARVRRARPEVGSRNGRDACPPTVGKDAPGRARHPGKMGHTCGAAPLWEAESAINTREGREDAPRAALPRGPRDRSGVAWSVTCKHATLAMSCVSRKAWADLRARLERRWSIAGGQAAERGSGPERPWQAR